MTTPHGWEPRPGPTRGDPARHPPRGSGGWARDSADPRRQGPRGGAPSPGESRNAGPSFTPSRGPGGPRDNGPGGSRGGNARPPRNSSGYPARSGPADDFAGGGPRQGGPGRPVNKGRPSGGPGGPVNGPIAFRPTGVARWLGRLPTRAAMLMVIAGAVLGVIVTLAANQEPGALLGFFVIVGSVAAVLAIQRAKAYLLFPVPALVFFVAAVLIGKVHDANLGSSTAGLASGFTQWAAGIFFPAVVATLMVVLIGGARWLLGRQLIAGQSLLSPGGPTRQGPPRGSARPAPSSRPRRPAASAQDRDDPDRDAWADDDPFGEQQAFKTAMIPAVRQDQPGKPERPAWMGRPGGAPRQPRDRDQRTDRDPWGDPRLRPDRGQPPGPRPRPNAQPRDRGQRPSFNPNPNPSPPRPQRPQRRQPPEGWNQR